MADETRKILLELNIDTVKSVKNISELKKLQKAANVELEKTKIGTEEYKKLESASGLLTKRITGLRDNLKQNTKELDVQKGSARDLSAQYSALTRALREAAPGSQVLGLSFEEAKKKANSLRQEVKKFEEDLGNTAPNVGNYGTAFKDATSEVQVFGVSLGRLFQIILANPFLLILSALAALGKALMSNDTIATFFKGVMTGIGIVMDNISAVISEVALALVEFGSQSSGVSKIIKETLVRAFNSLIAPIMYVIDLMPAVKAALEGEFAEAADIAGDATVKFGKSVAGLNEEVPKFVENLVKAVSAGIDYEAQLDAIEAKQSKLNVTTAKLENQRDRLFLQSKDLAKSEEERIAISERAEDVNKKILAGRVALLNEEIAAEQRHFESLGRDSIKREESEFKINDLLVKRLNFENEALRFEELNQNKRNAIIEKQLADQERLTAEQEKARKKREEDEVKLAEKIKDSDNKLQQFRLDLSAKRATDIDEKLKAELAAEDFRVSVLLSDDKLLASEREFILADSGARKLDLQIAADKASLDQTHKTEAERAAAIQKSNDQVASYANQTAGILQSINQTNLNNQLTDLENKKNQELKFAGNNAKKRAKIEADYNQKRESLEKEAAHRSNAIAIVQAIVNTALSVTKALGSAPPPANFILAALNGAAGAAQVGAIISQDNKLADGGIINPRFAKGGMIGGKPHSLGGTKFYGEDGSVFEAEKDEGLVVVNKYDTPLLSKLSAINSIHGKPFFREGGALFADGGFASRSSSQQIVNDVMSRNQLIDIITSQPAPIVTVEDINAGVGGRSRVVSRATV
jgi:hypothetical protein